MSTLVWRRFHETDAYQARQGRRADPGDAERGAARRRQRAKAKRLLDKNNEEVITLPGIVFGTPAYMAPEHCLGEPLEK